MLKHRDAHYGVGRTKDVGVWWKWKIDPMSVDAVLIYAQRGHGRRASLYTDYTFAVWNGPPDDPNRQLVPFAKAYSGLTDAEIAQVDAIIRKTTRESFGPVRSVEATQVFELGFEGIARSPRHKSGIAVRFPRTLRWRQGQTRGRGRHLADAGRAAARKQRMSEGAAKRWMAARGWQPFAFQQQVWQAMAEGRSGLLHATTGAGKTYAVWLGALERFSALAPVDIAQAAPKKKQTTPAAHGAVDHAHARAGG